MKLKILSLAPALLLISCGNPANSGGTCSGILPGDLVITEYMNDPAGTDTGQEWIEIHNATTSDVSLSGLTVFVSAADGSKEKTHVITKLTIPAAGYAALGDVRPPAEKPLYISYSYADALGALGNTDGAIGLRCGSSLIDKVVYTSSFQSGHSHELDGKLQPDSAINDNDANWCSGKTEFAPGLFGTPGLKNDPCAGAVGAGTCLDVTVGSTARTVVTPNAGDLVITEVMADPSAASDSTGEWFEVLARRDVDLNGVTLSAGTATGSPSTSTVGSTDCLHLNTGDYAVFAKRGDLGIDGGTGLFRVVDTFSFSLPNSNAFVALSSGGTELDRLAWTAVPTGASLQVSSDALDPALNDIDRNRCAATTPYLGGDRGTPGDANEICGSSGATGATCTDPTSGSTRAVVSPAVGDVVISEFMANPNAVSDTTGEWIELYVAGDVDLNGLSIGNEGTSTSTITSATCIHPGQGTYAVLARSSDPALNGGLPPVAATFTTALANSTGRAIKVLLADGGLLDQITYETSGTGRSTQLDPAFLDPVSNDNNAHFCLSDAGTYGAGDIGSPGAANHACP